MAEQLRLKTVPKKTKETDRRRQKLINNPRWGNWRLNRNTFELVNQKRGYSVDLGRCNDAADILDWIFHVFNKGWVGRDTTSLLMAFEDILHPQLNYCPMGKNKRANARKVAAEWLTPMRPTKP